MQAFKARKTEVTIRDGRKFKCNYDVEPLTFPVSGETRKLVHVAPLDGTFAPGGYFNLKEVTSVEWVKDNSREVKRELMLPAKVGDKDGQE